MKQEFREFISGFGEETVDEISAFGLQIQFIADVKNRMKEIGINQKELSEKMNINPSFLSSVFNGHKLLNLKHIAKMERILKIDIAIEVKASEDTVLSTQKETDVYHKYETRELIIAQKPTCSVK